MKRKIGTILEEDLVYKAKQAALSQKQSLSQLLEDALKNYLSSIEGNRGKKQRKISQITFGAMKIPHKAIKTILKESGVYET